LCYNFIMKNTKKGFTLIELLVVIAIIGVLAAVILASLGAARNKGNAASAKTSMKEIKTQAELYLNTYSTYNSNGVDITSGACSTLSTVNSIVADPTIQNLMKSIKANSTTDIECYITATTYTMAVALKDGTWWCIDSTGVSRGTRVSGATYTSMNGANGAHTLTTSPACN
jgi:prepilin-type N-terminal cleavage/methylation domain-containing protein